KLDTQEVVRHIRRAVASDHELQVHDVALLKPGSIPKTSSGKIQRHRCRANFLSQQLTAKSFRL
ncbi:MAG: fatty acyl-AMP ligase, partial [Moorea sp. SIO4A1]